MTVNQIFRERLNAAIAASEMRLVELAHRSGYDVGYIRRLRNGDRANPTIMVVWSLAQSLGVCPHWMLGDER